MAYYKLEVFTSCVHDAGTDANITFVFGRDLPSQDVRVTPNDPDADDFERGMKDIYYFDDPPLSTDRPRNWVFFQRAGGGVDWKLDKINLWVRDGPAFTYEWYKWFIYDTPRWQRSYGPEDRYEHVRRDCANDALPGRAYEEAVLEDGAYVLEMTRRWSIEELGEMGLETRFEW